MIRLVLALLALAACGSEKTQEAAPAASEETASARKDLAEIDQNLASGNTNRVSAVCSVSKMEWPQLEKADPALASQIKKRCERDLYVAEMTAALAKAEAAVKADPQGFHPECSGLGSYNSALAKGGYREDPEVVVLNERWLAVCPKAKP